MESDVVGRKLEPAPIRDPLGADWIFRPVGIDADDAKTFTLARESPTVIGWLQSELRCQNFEQGLVRRIEGTVFHRDADTEPDPEPMSQIDVAQIASFDDKTMGLRHISTCLHEVTA